MSLASVWYGDGLADRSARALLTPLAATYRVASAVRNALFDRGALPVRPVVLPTVSVGNLSAGGTGKTPTASWIANALHERGASPALVLRGYGGDEAAVHASLDPTSVVIVDPDRVRGIARAAERGSDVAVLDDGFQHRWAARDEDLVLVSADRWHVPQRPLPAGPWREPISSLRRATVVAVTRKAASLDEARRLLHQLLRESKRDAGAVISLQPSELRALGGGERLPLGDVRAKRLLVFAGIGDVQAFHSQVLRLGADVQLEIFPDHHRYSPREIAGLAERATAAERVICTLKDAVKLRDTWPRQAPPLWYFSLRVEVEHGSDVLDAMLWRLLDARRHRQPPAQAGA